MIIWLISCVHVLLLVLLSVSLVEDHCSRMSVLWWMWIRTMGSRATQTAFFKCNLEQMSFYRRHDRVPGYPIIPSPINPAPNTNCNQMMWRIEGWNRQCLASTCCGSNGIPTLRIFYVYNASTQYCYRVTIGQLIEDCEMVNFQSGYHLSLRKKSPNHLPRTKGLSLDFLDIGHIWFHHILLCLHSPASNSSCFKIWSRFFCWIRFGSASHLQRWPGRPTIFSFSVRYTWLYHFGHHKLLPDWQLPASNFLQRTTSGNSYNC